MKKIALIYMGGTFGCIGDPLTPMPQLDFEPQLRRVLPKHVQIDFFNAPAVKDSSACTAVDWLQLIQQIQHLQSFDYDHFIVIHGTDTLSYAAATLARFLQHSTHVILTASQYPLLNIQGNDLRTFTDALDNLNTAIEALSKISSGVYVVFHHQVLHANSVFKTHTTALDAFHGTPYQHTLVTQSSAPFQILEPHILAIKELNILNWSMLPMELPALMLNLQGLIEQPPDVLVIQSYGAGNLAVNAHIIEVFAQLQSLECAVILDTQVPFGGIDQRYAISQWVSEAKILLNNTQSHADLYAKILKMYLQYPTKSQWHAHWSE